MEQWNHIKLREKAIATGKLLMFVFLNQQRGLESIICLCHVCGIQMSQIDIKLPCPASDLLYCCNYLVFPSFTAVRNVTWTSWNFCVQAVCVGTMNLVLAISWESWFHLWWIIYSFARIVLPQVWKASKRTKQVSINTTVSVFNNSMKQGLTLKKFWILSVYYTVHQGTLLFQTMKYLVLSSRCFSPTNAPFY